MTVCSIPEVSQTHCDSDLNGWPVQSSHPICQWPVSIVGTGCVLSVRPQAIAPEPLENSPSGKLSDVKLDALSLLTLRDKKKLDRFSIIALAAARLALQSASDRLAEAALKDCGVFVGNATAGWTFTEPQLRNLHRPSARLDSISPYLATAWFPAAPQGLISIELGLHGFSKTIATDRCAGSQAIGLAFDQMKLGRCSTALAGGVEAPLTPFVAASRPVAAQHRLAEGSAFVAMQASQDNRISIAGHRLGVRRRGQFTEAWLSIWLHALTVAPFEEPPIVVCTVEPDTPDEKAAIQATRTMLHTEPELPLRVDGDALAASSASGVALAFSKLEAYPSPGRAVALCIGQRYVHAVVLRAN